MPATITASSVHKNILRADGKRRIVYQYTVELNDLSTETHYMGPFTRPGAWDVNGNLSSYGTSMLDGLKDAEVDGVWQLAMTPADQIDDLSTLQADVFNRTDSPQYTIKKRIRKKLIYYFMRLGDANYAMNIKSVYDDLPTGDVALKNALDINDAQLNKLKDKASEFYGTPLTAKSGAAIITGDFTTASDEWGDG